jgi:hypothetical protein
LDILLALQKAQVTHAGEVPPLLLLLLQIEYGPFFSMLQLPSSSVNSS